MAGEPECLPFCFLPKHQGTPPHTHTHSCLLKHSLCCPVPFGTHYSAPFLLIYWTGKSHYESGWSLQEQGPRKGGGDRLVFAGWGNWSVFSCWEKHEGAPGLKGSFSPRADSSS